MASRRRSPLCAGSSAPRDRTKLGEYFDAVRDVEQRIAKSESTNSTFEVPSQPVGVPATFREYAELMFDLQVLAFQADITRVSTFMMARENINRSYPEIGLPEAHHSMSHHDNNPEKLKAYAKLNHYHAETLAYYLKRLDSIQDGDGTLLDHTAVLYGGGMSDANVHNNYNVPVVVVGGKSTAAQGRPPPEVPEGNAAGEPDAGPDRPLRRAHREIWRQHVRDRSIDGLSDRTLSWSASPRRL